MVELEQSQPQEIEPKDPFANLKANPWPEAEPVEVVPIVEPPDTLLATIDGIVYPALYKVNDQYCYTEADKERLLTYLTDNGVKVKIEPLTPIDGLRVTEGVKYNSVDEAVNHIKRATPESLMIPYLKEQLQTAEAWLAVALTKLDTVETVSATLAKKVEALEVKTAEPIKVADEPIIKK
jgi:hypothetical protein